MCTYCSIVNGLMLSAIRFAWKGEPWDDVEILLSRIRIEADAMDEIQAKDLNIE